MVNGRALANLNFTRESHKEWFTDKVVKFDRTIPTSLSEDSHLIVVAYGSNSDLKIGYGSSGQAGIRPCAYNNPIFVDLDGDGFTPNGDTLGSSPPVEFQSMMLKNLCLRQVSRINKPLYNKYEANYKTFHQFHFLFWQTAQIIQRKHGQKKNKVL